MSDKVKYKLAEIALDADGVYWGMYLGDMVEQGGISFGWDQIGSEDVDAVLGVIKRQLEKHKEEHMKLIKSKEK